MQLLDFHAPQKGSGLAMRHGSEVVDDRKGVGSLFLTGLRRFQTKSKGLAIQHLVLFIAQHSSFAYATPTSPHYDCILQ